MSTVVVGGNEVDVHFKGVVPGRDFPLGSLHDIRNAEAGDPCPRCGASLEVKSGLEIGHVFKLGTKYSKSMGATYLDEKGHETQVIMGCYGIGVNRIVAAAVEASHDANGIVWPFSLAPYHVLIVPLQLQNPAVMELAASLEAALTAAGLDVLVDDRDQRPGFKFKDADLIGIPLRVVISERGLKEGKIEIKWRHEGGGAAGPRRDGREVDPRRGRGGPPAVTTTPCAERRTGAGRREDDMSRMPPCPGCRMRCSAC